MLLSPDLKSFEAEIDRQVTQALASRELTEDDRSLVLGALALGKSTVVYWNAQNDIFEGDVVARGNGKFWADLGGFVAGFTGTLVYNNNVSGGPLNPFTNGAAVGGLASALVDNDDDEEN
ncbi:MAG: hypothetical protein VX768_02915 [Planctomycetota bacterium]|nr:hypothetical protein [Planctomycetota bacterium]